MLVLEIAAQGVKGAVPAAGRAVLKPGYNVVAADGGALRRVLEALLYAAPDDAAALARAAGQAPVRAGLTLAGDDRVTYRLVRDFRAGAQLQRYDGASRAFSLVASDPSGIAAALASPIGVPARERLAALLSLSASELPSRRAAAPTATPPPVARRADPADQRARLDALRAELERALESEKLQYRLDGLQTRLFKSEEALKEGGRVREGAAAGDAALAELVKVAEAEGALGDPEARFAAFERANAKRDEAVAKAAEERAALEREAAPPPPLWKVWPLWAGVAAGVGAIALALSGGRSSPGLRYAALLDVPAFGWAAWTALGWIQRLEDAGRGERRLRLVDDFEKKAVEQHEREVAPVVRALAVAGVPTVAELRERLGKLREARLAAEEARARLAAWETSPEVRDAREARGKLEEEIREVETRLGSAAGGFVRDARTVEAEIERVEAELAAAGPERGAGAPAAPPAIEPEPAARPAAGGPAPVADPLRACLSAAAAALGGEPALRLRDLTARAGQFAAALSQQRLSLVLEGGAVRIASGGRAAPEALASPADRDLCWLAARLAVLERAVSAGGVALVDDAFAGFPDGVRRLAARLLKQVARGGQVLHATSDPAFREAADHVAA